MPDVNFPKKFLQLLKPRLAEMLATLRRFVTAESPSLEKAAADRCCGVIAAEWNKHGARVERIAQKHRGDLPRITYATGKSRPSSQLLVLGHYDTVYSTGTLGKMPFRVKGGKAYGPGTFDMKAGIVQALFALQTLQQTEIPLHKRLVFLWTSDEEIGSEASRKIFEAEARRSDAVFVLEPSFGPRGLLKTARKGVGEAELIVHGRASHAGLAPQEGSTPFTNWRGNSGASRNGMIFAAASPSTPASSKAARAPTSFRNALELFSICARFAFPICATSKFACTICAPFKAAPGSRSPAVSTVLHSNIK